jgi:hypothetical protein
MKLDTLYSLFTLLMEIVYYYRNITSLLCLHSRNNLPTLLDRKKMPVTFRKRKSQTKNHTTRLCRRCPTCCKKKDLIDQGARNSSSSNRNKKALIVTSVWKSFWWSRMKAVLTRKSIKMRSIQSSKSKEKCVKCKKSSSFIRNR